MWQEAAHGPGSRYTCLLVSCFEILPPAQSLTTYSDPGPRPNTVPTGTKVGVPVGQVRKLSSEPGRNLLKAPQPGRGGAELLTHPVPAWLSASVQASDGRGAAPEDEFLLDGDGDSPGMRK